MKKIFLYIVHCQANLYSNQWLTCLRIYENRVVVVAAMVVAAMVVVVVIVIFFLFLLLFLLFLPLLFDAI